MIVQFNQSNMCSEEGVGGGKDTANLMLHTFSSGQNYFIYIIIC